MNLVMFGPGYGHNIEPHLDFFQRNHDKYNLTMIYRGRNEFASKMPNIKFVKLSFKNILVINQVLSNKTNEFIWQHGNNILLYLYIKIFKNIAIPHMINIWSNRLFLDIKKSKLKKMFAKTVLNGANIHCNWYGTRDNLVSVIPNATYNVLVPGLHHDVLSSTQTDMIEEGSEYFQSLIAVLEKTQGKKFFYPKSMTDAAGHFLILEAGKKLLDKGIDNFQIIFRRGNEINENYENKIQETIALYKLKENVIIQEYQYLLSIELAELWKKMDCGLQIAFHDQLSTTFVEPMLFEKELIASHIEPYKIYVDKFNIELELCELNADSISIMMEKVCKGIVTNSKELKHRQNVILENLNFDVNVEKIMNMYI